MSQKRSGREVIAHFEGGQVIFDWLLLLAAGAIFYFWFLSFLAGYGTPPPAYPGHRAIEAPGLVLFAVALLYAVPASIKLTYRWFKEGGAAIWIENGRLVYVYPEVLDVGLSEVVFVGMTEIIDYMAWPPSTRIRSLTIRLRGGKEVKLPKSYAENTDNIIAMLRQRIGQPEVAAENN